MEPSYHNLQLVALDKHDENFSVGDVIAFRCEGLSSVLVKRIAACERDTVVIQGATLYVNGKKAPGYPELGFSYAGLLSTEQTLQEGEFIVLGDNLEESRDSRYEAVGVVRVELILGKVIA